MKIRLLLYYYNLRQNYFGGPQWWGHYCKGENHVSPREGPTRNFHTGFT